MWLDKIKRIQELVSILNKASYEYYNTGHPFMEDSEFDTLLNELQRLEVETGTVLKNSPTQNAGSKVAKEQKKITHEHLMLSLDKIHTIDEIKDFVKDKDCIASVKLDGLTCSATYMDGVLTRLETRGNGETGTDIMVHKNSIKGLPLRINHGGKYVVDGECIVPYDKFEKINATLSENDKFSNPRNMASGALNLLDSNISAKRGLQFVVWNVIEDSEEFSNNMVDNLRNAYHLGFELVPYIDINVYCNNEEKDRFNNILDLIKQFANTNKYPMDGAVFSYRDIEYGKSLGRTGHHFRHSVAYKFEDSDAETTLTNIEWTMGKTGQLTPVAIFNDVELEGTKVNRASLHNISICKSLELGIGDTITIYKANMIIPQIRDNLTRSNTFEIPTICPICGGKTEIVKDNDSEVLMCTNQDCKGKLLGRLTHFVSKNAIGIDNLSEQTLQKFIELGWLKSFADIYHLSEHKEQMYKLEGFGTKSVDKLLDNIEKSRDITLDRFIYSLSVPLIGRTASKVIANYFNGNWNDFWYAWNSDYNWKLLNDFGDAMSSSMFLYILNHRDMVSELSKEFNFENHNTSNNKKENILGKVFVITGSLCRYLNREELINAIESMGGKVSGSVSSKTDFLICNDTNSTSSKNTKAKKLGIPIITEEEFIDMIS